MILLVNKYFPSRDFVAINIFGLIFARKENWQKQTPEKCTDTLNHEAIHTAQMRELGYIIFYILYFLEWLMRLPCCGARESYKRISFEVEAYAYDGDITYLANRKHYAQWKH